MKTARQTMGALLTFLLIGLAASPASAQNFQGGIGFQAGLPTGDYKDQIDKTGFGIKGDILWTPHASPFGIGLSFDWVLVGNETRKEPFSTTIPDVTVDVETQNALAQFMFLFRVQPKKGDIRPYADGLIGLNYLYTETSIKNASNDEEVASTTNFDDNAFAYGIGGGVLARVYSANSGARPLHVYIDFHFRVTFGGEAKYLKEGSIRRDNGTIQFDITESKTNITMVGVGVAVDF